MRIVHRDKKQGVFKLVAETPEDLYHLSRLVNPGDFVSASSVRKIKAGERFSTSEKKRVFLTLEVSETEFSEHGSQLRVSGRVREARPEEYVGLGSFHTLSIGSGDVFSIKKPVWRRYEEKLLSEWVEASRRPRVLAVLLDRERVLVAGIRQSGFSVLAEYGSGLEGKQGDEKDSARESFFENVYETVVKHAEEVDRVVVAGPGWVKDDFEKFLKENHGGLAKKVVLDSTSTASVSGVNELLRRGVLQRVVGESRIEEDTRLFEEALASIAKEDGLACYGLSECGAAASAGAVEKLLVLDDFLKKNPDVSGLLDKVEKARGSVFIFESSSEPGKRLSALGGLVAVLRYKVV